MMPDDQTTAPCPNCGAPNARDDHQRTTVVCRCGTHLRFVVPVFAPTMGGPAWWGWRTDDNRLSWREGVAAAAQHVADG